MDLCSKLTSAQTAQLSDSYTILEGTMNLVQAVYLNNNAAPFDNEKVRQAISYAINRQQILDMVADGHGAAVGSSIYPKLAKYFLPELVNYYEYNPRRPSSCWPRRAIPTALTCPSPSSPATSPTWTRPRSSWSSCAPSA